ncbi:hypothetical protein F0170_08210 [Pseudomonas sp. MAFF 730085]|uniref:Uncharacterized protein n=1 Tax=Pseudomonas kitaguniensis TaxID=2607908 RepID=A0A5N7JRD7_9PSED|nr:hypothetical protein [Pseudomonas kitaguniensis]
MNADGYHSVGVFLCLDQKHFFCGSGLARDAGTSELQVHRVDAIASKPAPTVDCVLLGRWVGARALSVWVI